MPDALDAARAHLRDTFGFADFRPGQAEIVRAALEGRDILAVMPTGGGKSLCFQLPALVQGGLTVVVSPLVALMRGQVLQMRALGVPAASLNASNDAAEDAEAVRALKAGELRLLYLAPERLMRPGTLSWLGSMNVTRMAVDEAHCVSEWGHDFRPEYRQIGEAREALGVPLSAFTATADAATREDIARRLFPGEPETFVQGFDRPNLHLAMAAKTDRRRQLLGFLRGHEGESGIIYCSSRKRTEETAAYLREEGFDAHPYHAGLDARVRAAAQDRFLGEDGVVVVATVAFGMGIDKPDVRFVVQADMPKSVEAYYQEIGRAGRDGLPADTLTLYGLDDIRLRRTQIDEGEAPEERKRVERHRLNALVALCEAPLCRRQTLLAYFGEAAPRCGACDLCLGGAETVDGTLLARKALSAVARTGERFGAEHLVAILTGDATEGVRRHGHDGLKTFGVGAEHDKKVWRAILRQLYAGGVLEMDLVGHGGFSITERGREVLFGREAVQLRRDVLEPPVRGGQRRAKAAKAALPADADEALLARLKALRTALARQQGVPAYVVFPDRSLVEMASSHPRSLMDLSRVHGVGAAKLDRYGEAFMEVLGEG